MELKYALQIIIAFICLLLIAPYGIEIHNPNFLWEGALLLIAPYGIEMKVKRNVSLSQSILLIAPYGIEIHILQVF